ncbi:MAG: M43 family zinc metalloprotease, partial [Bacteroidota bacterium]
MPKYYTLLAGLCCALLAFSFLKSNSSQPTSPFGFSKNKMLVRLTDSTHLNCSHTSVWNATIQKNPTLKKRHQKWEQEMLQLAEQAESSAQKAAVLYELPVVVHVIHNNGTENISDAQIQQAIEDLNEAFANQGFYNQDIGADTEIQFCLATQDPDGNITNGINRVVSTLTEMTEPVDDLDLKNIIRWNPLDYINIWVVKEVCSQVGDCSTAGYAYFPSAHGTDVDGIVIEAQWFGTTKPNSSVIAHEMGHYLGLYHTFQGGCNNNNCLTDGDRVCDTPPDQTSVPFPCSADVNSCDTDVNPNDPNNPFTTDQNDFSSNFMDYAFLPCLFDFSQGQATRMQNSILTARSSLLSSLACSSACPQLIQASFEVSATDILVGETVQFTNTSVGALYFDWEINQQPFNGIEFTFDEAGSYEVVLIATNNNANCVSVFTNVITVLCEAQASFEVATTQIQVGEVLGFNNTSTNANTVSWQIDGTTVSNDLNYQFVPAAAGIYNICLIAATNTCESEFCQEIIVESNNSGSEICGNGFDDDGDGLIDCFDPDCCESSLCANNFYTDCETEGCDTIVFDDFSMQLEWSTPLSKPVGPPGLDVIAGDINGDGIPEVIQTNEGQGILNVSSGVDGSTLWEITVWDIGRPVIADVDNDGTAEIFTTGSTPRRIEHDGTITAQGFVPNGGGSWYQIRANLADFNQDGQPELLILNHIIDVETMQILATLPLTDFTFFIDYGVGVPADVMPPSALCPDCDGLEFVIGPFLYSVNSTTFEFTQIHSVALNDPFITPENTTSLADMDKDGDLDAVVNGRSQNGLYVWDIQTPTIMYKEGDYTYPFDKSGHNYPAVADLDGDGLPEIICRNGSDLVAYNNDLATVDWFVPIQEFAGNATQSVFDVDGDGSPEVIFRDNVALKIFDGETGDLLSSIPCSSFTNAEMPATLDIDADGEAEIACECGGRVHVFGGAGDQPWANTRKIWNQFLNFNVHINDDMTIPIVQQQHHLVGDGNVMNSFLQQYAIPRELVPCEEICDNGIDDDNDGLIDCEDDDCCDATFCNNQPTPCDTCVFVGNLDLGMDVEICDNGIANFNAGSGFASYLWSDQSTDSTFTTTGAGDIWVIATDSCGTTYSDTVSVIIETVSQVDLGADVFLCEGEFATLGGGVFDNYQWFNSDTLVCGGCPSIPVSSVDTGEYILLGSSNLGCFSIDTVRVILLENIATAETQTLCAGESIEVFRQTITEATTVSENFTGSNGCDSLHTVEVIFIDTFATTEIQTLCAGESIEVFGQVITAATTVSENFTASNGCDSLHTVEVIFQDTFTTMEIQTLCAGESIEVFGQTITESTTVSENFTASNGCDSLHMVEVIFLDTFTTMEIQTLCAGESIEVFGQTITESTTVSENFTASNGCDSLHTVEVIF